MIIWKAVHSCHCKPFNLASSTHTQPHNPRLFFSFIYVWRLDFRDKHSEFFENLTSASSFLRKMLFLINIYETMLCVQTTVCCAMSISEYVLVQHSGRDPKWYTDKNIVDKFV